MSNLAQLDLEGNRIGEIVSLEGMKGLEYPYIEKNDIVDYSPIKYLDGLYEVHIEAVIQDDRP